MPIYEYRCEDCGKKTTRLILSASQAAEAPVCRHCGGSRLRKLVSRVAVLKSEESRLDSLADPSNLGGLDEEDPKSVARWMKKMGREMGEDLGDDFEQEIDRAVEEGDAGGEGDDFGGGEFGGGGPDED